MNRLIIALSILSLTSFSWANESSCQFESHIAVRAYGWYNNYTFPVPYCQSAYGNNAKTFDKCKEEAKECVKEMISRERKRDPELTITSLKLYFKFNNGETWDRAVLKAKTVVNTLGSPIPLKADAAKIKITENPILSGKENHYDGFLGAIQFYIDVF